MMKKLEHGFYWGLVFLGLGGLIIGWVMGDLLLVGGVILALLGSGLMTVCTVCYTIEKMLTPNKD